MRFSSARRIPTTEPTQLSFAVVTRAISRHLTIRSAYRPLLGNPKWIAGDSETVESKNSDVIGPAKASRLFGDALSCLHTDLTSALESKQLASSISAPMLSLP
jgi:hypothetical protein